MCIHSNDQRYCLLSIQHTCIHCSIHLPQYNYLKRRAWYTLVAHTLYHPHISGIRIFSVHVRDMMSSPMDVSVFIRHLSTPDNGHRACPQRTVVSTEIPSIADIENTSEIMRTLLSLLLRQSVFPFVDFGHSKGVRSRLLTQLLPGHTPLY